MASRDGYACTNPVNARSPPATSREPRLASSCAQITASTWFDCSICTAHRAALVPQLSPRTRDSRPVPDQNGVLPHTRCIARLGFIFPFWQRCAHRRGFCGPANCSSSTLKGRQGNWTIRWRIDRRNCETTCLLFNAYFAGRIHWPACSKFRPARSAPIQSGER